MDTDNPLNLHLVEEIKFKAAKTANLEALLESPVQFFIQIDYAAAKLEREIIHSDWSGKIFFCWLGDQRRPILRNQREFAQPFYHHSIGQTWITALAHNTYILWKGVCSGRRWRSWILTRIVNRESGINRDVFTDPSKTLFIWHLKDLWQIFVDVT